VLSVMKSKLRRFIESAVSAQVVLQKFLFQ
jgi:hypothetical protein